MKRAMRRQVRKHSVRPLAAAVTAALGSQWVPVAGFAQVSIEQVPLEEIVVTASRRETSIQDLPFNISAFSGEQLEQQRVTDLREFARWVPGLTVVDQGSRGSDIMTVRGLNTLSLNASEFLDNTSGDTVATYMGDVPVYVDLKMKDIERVEVLLGPQGTLYGAGTLGGAVRYIPNAPDPDAFELEFSGDVFDLAESDGMGYETDVVINAPIVDGKLAFRGSLSYLDDPGFIDYTHLVRDPGVSNPQPDPNDPAAVAANLYRVNDANTEETISTRLGLLWNVSDNVTATFNYYLQNQDSGSRTINHRDAFGTGIYESAHRFLEPNERDNSLFTAEIAADLGFAELTSATGISRYEELGQRDQTDLLLSFQYGYETFPSFVAFTRETADDERINQELRLVSNGTGPVSWIAGLFYNEYEINQTSSEFTPGIPEFWAISLPTGDLEYLEITADTLTERAIFGEVGYRFTDRLQRTVGGRFFDYETDEFNSFDIPFVDISNAEQVLGEDDGFLGKLNLAYDFSDSVMGYVTLSEGYRVGGTNAVALCIEPPPPGQNVCANAEEKQIDPDRTTNFELGVHSTLSDGRVRLNAAIYRIDWEDIQTAGVTAIGGVPITLNGGKAETQGLELSVQVQSRGPWYFQAGYAHNEAELTTDAPGLVDGDDAFAGDRLSGTPEQQGSVLVGYNRMLGSGWQINANYGVTATSDVLTKTGLRSNGEILGGFSLHNAMLSLGKDRWTATLYAENLTNKFAETAVRQDPSLITNIGGFDLRRYFRNVIRPRTVGVEVRYTLGP
jgi:iron complex outermembrane receptor protein